MLSGPNTWGKEDLERRNHELSVLNEIARELNRSVELGEALGFTLSQVAELLGLRTAWIWLIDDSSPEPYLAAASNLPPALADDPRRMDGSGYCYCLDTYKRGDLEGAANVNVLTCSRLDGLVDGTGGLRYHASIPLYAGEKKLGVMNVASPQWRGLSPEDLQLLSTIGDLLAIAVERASLFDRSARLGAVEERNRLAREIHDTLAQGLTATGLQLESAEALLDGDSGAERAREPLRRPLGSGDGRGHEIRDRERQPPASAAGRGRPLPRLPGSPNEHRQPLARKPRNGQARGHTGGGATHRQGRRPRFRPFQRR
jgi:two-component system NarL family sensor kinase